jgi:glycosyltransferase involved in cell wall biosynthesis
MDSNPFVSIGMPVYNGEKYLEQALESILNQTYTNFELIISDNASVDGTGEICQSFARKDQRIKLSRNEKNLGASSNFNKVFHLASGKYFKWAAYDDLLAPDFLAECVAVLDHMPDVVLCFPKSMIIDENGKHLGEHTFEKNMNSPESLDRFRDAVLFPDPFFQLFGLMRPGILSQTGLHGAYPSADSVLLAELALRGKFYEIPAPLFFPRYHSEQSIRGIYQIERNRVLWFDTSLEGKIQLPKWKYLFAYIGAVNRYPQKIMQRLLCYGIVIRWALIPPHFRALGKDILLATVQFIKNGFRTRKKVNIAKAD